MKGRLQSTRLAARNLYTAVYISTMRAALLVLLMVSLGVSQKMHHHHALFPEQEKGMLQQNSQLELLIQRGREVAPRPLVLCMASKSYISPLFNVAESIRRTGGRDAIATLSVVVLDSELVKILPPSLETVSFAVLSKELGLCDTNTTRSCDSASIDPTKVDNKKRQENRTNDEGEVEVVAKSNARNDAYQSLWSFRIKLVLHLLDHGVGVIVNDLDALWLKDPWVSRFKDMPEYDLLASRGEYPKKYGHKSGWGSAVCMGFVYFKGSPATKRFIDLAYESDPGVIDDQVWINTALDRQGIIFPRLQRGSAGFKKMEARHKDDLYTGHLQVADGPMNLTLTVGMLPPQEVTRRCHSGKKNITIPEYSLVEHCHVTKSGKSFVKKQKMLHVRRTWYLKDKYGEFFQASLETEFNHSSPYFMDPKNHTAAWMILLDAIRDKYKMMVRPKSLFG